MNVQVTDLLMRPDPRFARPASRERLTKVAAALEKNNIAAFVVSNRDAARPRFASSSPRAPRSSPLPREPSRN